MSAGACVGLEVPLTCTSDRLDFPRLLTTLRRMAPKMAPEQSRLSRTVRMLELNLDQAIAGHAVVRGIRTCPGDAPLRGLTLQFRAARSDPPSDLARTEAVYGVPGCRPRLGPGSAESGQRRKPAPSRLADGLHASRGWP